MHPKPVTTTRRFMLKPTTSCKATVHQNLAESSFLPQSPSQRTIGSLPRKLPSRCLQPRSMPGHFSSRLAKKRSELVICTEAWNYWTTLLVETPDYSTVWQTFATEMHSLPRFIAADRAWSAAFALRADEPRDLAPECPVRALHSTRTQSPRAADEDYHQHLATSLRDHETARPNASEPRQLAKVSQLAAEAALGSGR